MSEQVWMNSNGELFLKFNNVVTIDDNEYGTEYRVYEQSERHLNIFLKQMGCIYLGEL